MTYCFKKKSRYVYPLPLAVIMLFAYSQVLYAATGYSGGSSKNEMNLLQQKNIKVTGVVTDAKGAPIKGVSITQKSLKGGTMTDAEGRYSISVPDGQTVLVFSAIGYLEKEENINDRDKIDITLFESISDLDDVVVIGYGTQKKEMLLVLSHLLAQSR
ncbi:carboxypeptidase-like regulatory domain-containing protein [Niabella hibiscisoli]|uniref:carboxypeptidase-like regulatory domain-containing protein n=1 Tax=Niabella hibiscisoli TaxID=1825928 RepID=UPI001F10BC22|nr:carboxypeptidase-like regulatory domain-containing protein [Niabella hibiscisoli]MCH5720814.1 carboxypeptidase-like regulatory domain-containing protein [Niabella hibiscisoli]